MIPSWQAAAKIPLWNFVYGKRTSQHRPLDIGGPRDQWLEQSPWDEH